MSQSFREPLDVVLPSLPAWLLREYFKDLGGVELGDGWFGKDGWRARASEAESKKLGSLHIRQVRLQLEGDPDSLEKIRPQLELKLIRGGG